MKRTYTYIYTLLLRQIICGCPGADATCSLQTADTHSQVQTEP